LFWWSASLCSGSSSRTDKEDNEVEEAASDDVDADMNEAGMLEEERDA
jgi:hypothetical protein